MEVGGFCIPSPLLRECVTEMWTETQDYFKCKFFDSEAIGVFSYDYILLRLHVKNLHLSIDKHFWIKAGNYK